jgi:hypothetical protein
VKDGTIQQARADKILERLEQRLANGWTRKAPKEPTTAPTAPSS